MHRVCRRGSRFGGQGGLFGFCTISCPAPVERNDIFSANLTSYLPLLQGHHAFSFLWGWRSQLKGCESL